MFPGNNMDFIAYERHKDLLRKAEQMRLIKALRLQRSNERGKFRKVTHWLGIHMVKWGLKLQDYSSAPPSRATAGITNTGYGQN